ncbi:hypothetical protein JY97_01080 [Alkalispirochaeta odontotermitis]|nr:hypothetical protein JY97_01080 [Alkalispirochaeta odontotermitis]
MIKAILVSAVSHGFFITMILFASAEFYESSAFTNNRIRVRIDSNPNTEHSLKTPTVVESENSHLASVSRKSVSKAEEGSMDDKTVIGNESVFGGELADEFAALLNYELPPRSKPGEPVPSLDAADSSVNFDEQPSSGSSLLSPWLINWVNGREREILSFPIVDVAQFPQETEKLLDVVMKIRVSAQGEVLSAELIPPGSGDTRIDRYLHGAALQLTLEPRLDNEEVQEAHLRLLFLEESL